MRTSCCDEAVLLNSGSLESSCCELFEYGTDCIECVYRRNAMTDRVISNWVAEKTPGVQHDHDQYDNSILTN